MLRFFYNLLFPFVFLAMLPGFLVRMTRRGNYRRNFGQRLGIYSPETRKRLASWSRPVWMHAVSVGEVQVALKLITAWRRRRPSLQVVLSTTTSTGHALASKQAGNGMVVIYHPVDMPLVVASAMRLIHPSMLVLVEAEVWPNLVAQARACGASVVLVNARLSPRSERRYLAFRRIVRGLFSQLDAVCLQDPDDLHTWRKIGPPAEKLHVLGGVKYDSLEAESALATSTRPQTLLATLGIAESAPVILGGSTHPGEEAALGQAFIEARGKFPTSFLVVAPRHVERAGEAVRDLESLGLRVARRSKITTCAPAAVDALVLDTTGELRDWYAAATLAFIGKSLLAQGGQNPVEAIHAGIPFICGPHMGNFRALMQSLERAQAVVKAADVHELAAAIIHLIEHPQLRQSLVAAARQALAFHTGATQRTIDLLQQMSNYST